MRKLVIVLLQYEYVVNNSLTPSLRNYRGATVGRDEALRLLRSYLLLASSPPPEEKAVRRCSHGFARRFSSSSGLGDLGRRSFGRNHTPQDSVLPAPTFSRCCLNRLGKRPCLLVFHASSRRRFFYGTILRTVHRSLAMVAR